MADKPLFISKFKRNEVKQFFDTIIRRSNLDGLTFLAAPKALEFGRILVITSRKCGSAAKRNRIRRRLKSIFYEDKLFLNSFDIAVIVKKEGIENSFDNLKQSLLKFINVSK